MAYRLSQPGWVSPGVTIHFTITLTNDSGSAIPLAPCPLYRMYLVGSAEPKADRLLNCAAAGSSLRPGQSLSFDMVFVMAGRRVGRGWSHPPGASQRVQRARDRPGLGRPTALAFGRDPRRQLGSPADPR